MEITDKAIDFMERSVAAKKPFYTYVPYTLVHFPTLPPEQFKGATGNGDWADCLAQVDHNVARLLDTIDRLGLRDDTIVVFTSDNGADTSTLHWRGSAGPWAGTMFTPMEGSNRVPFIVRWPGRIAADRESDAIVHEVDTFTTLLRFVDADVPDDRPIDGVDQSGLLLGDTDSSAREGFPIFFGEKLYAAKWRNYFVWQVDAFDAVMALGVALFLRHLWATDGSVKWDRKVGQGRIYYASTSERLTDDVRQLLLRLRISSRAYRIPQGEYRYIWHLHISGVNNQLRLLRLVDVHGEKFFDVREVLTNLEGIKSNDNVDTVPREVWGWVRQGLTERRMTQRAFAEAMQTKFCGSTMWKHSPSRGRLHRAAAVLDDQALHDLTTNDVFWDKVVEITRVGERAVFDASVEGADNYVAQGRCVRTAI